LSAPTSASFGLQRFGSHAVARGQPAEPLGTAARRAPAGDDNDSRLGDRRPGEHRRPQLLLEPGIGVLLTADCIAEIAEVDRLGSPLISRKPSSLTRPGCGR
jgi:hypothetical protein